MKSIIKTLLFGMFLFVAFGVNAQESGKYEYGAVELRFNGAPGYVLAKSFNSGYSEEKIDKKTFSGAYGLTDVTPLVQEINKLSAEGWVVYNVNYTTFSVIYSIRKKKQ